MCVRIASDDDKSSSYRLSDYKITDTGSWRRSWDRDARVGGDGPRAWEAARTWSPSRAPAPDSSLTHVRVVPGRARHTSFGPLHSGESYSSTEKRGPLLFDTKRPKIIQCRRVFYRDILTKKLVIFLLTFLFGSNQKCLNSCTGSKTGPCPLSVGKLSNLKKLKYDWLIISKTNRQTCCCMVN